MPLHRAARAGDVAAVAALAAADPASVGAPNEHGTTPLMLAAALEGEDAAAAVCAALLAPLPPGPLRASVLDARDADGFTALHWAAALAEAPASRVTVLMAAGADAGAACARLGETPLHRAARFGRAAAVAAITAHIDAVVLPSLIRAQNRWFQSPWDVAGHTSDPAAATPLGGVLVPHSARTLDRDKRRVALEALAASDPSLRVGVFFHPDCLDHITFSRDASIEHQEAPERLTAIMKRVRDPALFSASAEVTTITDFPPANEVQVLRAHSLEYVSLVVALDRHVRKQATAVPFTPLVARAMQQQRGGGGSRSSSNSGSGSTGGSGDAEANKPGSRGSTNNSSASSEEAGPGFTVAADAAAGGAAPGSSTSSSVASRVAELGRPGTSDTTFSPGSLPAALRGAGAVCAAIDAVVAGAYRHAFCAIRPPGHHAGYQGLLRDFASTQTCGFCIFNSVAIGALHALDTHRSAVKRVAILDIDVHSGNGTEEIVKRWSDAQRSKKSDQSLFFFSTHLYDVERSRSRSAGGEEGGSIGGSGEGTGAGGPAAPVSPPRRVTRSRNGVAAPRASNPDEITGDAALAAAVAGGGGGGGGGARRGRSSNSGKGGTGTGGSSDSGVPPETASAPTAPPPEAAAASTAQTVVSEGEGGEDVKPPPAKRARLAPAPAPAPHAPRSILKRGGSGAGRVPSAAGDAESEAQPEAVSEAAAAAAPPQEAHKPVLLKLGARAAGAAGVAAEAEAAAATGAPLMTASDDGDDAEAEEEQKPRQAGGNSRRRGSGGGRPPPPLPPPLVRSVSFSEDSGGTVSSRQDVPRPTLSIVTDEPSAGDDDAHDGGDGVVALGGAAASRASRRLLAGSARKAPLKLRLAGKGSGSGNASAAASTGGGHVTPPPRLLSRRTLGAAAAAADEDGAEVEEDEDEEDASSSDDSAVGLELAEHVFEGGISVTSRKSLGDPASVARASGEGGFTVHATASRVASPRFVGGASTPRTSYLVERGTPAALPPLPSACGHAHAHTDGCASVSSSSSAVAGRLLVSGSDAVSRVDASVFTLNASPTQGDSVAAAAAAAAAAYGEPGAAGSARHNAADARVAAAAGGAGSASPPATEDASGDSTIVYAFYPGTGAEDRLENNILNAPVQPLWRERKETKNTTRDLRRAKSGRFAVRRLVLERLIPALRAFGPDLILISAGFDGGAGDVGNSRGPLEGLNLTEADFRWITAQVLGVARVCCPGRVVSVLEGGYGKFKMVAPGRGGSGAGGGNGGAGTTGAAVTGEPSSVVAPDAAPQAPPSSSTSNNGPRWYLDRGPFADNVAAHLRGLVDDGGAVLPPTAGLTAADSDSEAE